MAELAYDFEDKYGQKEGINNLYVKLSLLKTNEKDPILCNPEFGHMHYSL